MAEPLAENGSAGSTLAAVCWYNHWHKTAPANPVKTLVNERRRNQTP
jgi:hypothetical protein